MVNCVLNSVLLEEIAIPFHFVLDNRKAAIQLPDLMPVVLGLSACSNLVYDEGVDVTLKCKARGWLPTSIYNLDVCCVKGTLKHGIFLYCLGLSEDDDSLLYAWELIKPGGIKLSMAGNLAKSVEQNGPKLRLLGMRKQKDFLYCRCLVARKVGNGARYGSYYFRIGGTCESSKFIFHFLRGFLLAHLLGCTCLTRLDSVREAT